MPAQSGALVLLKIGNGATPTESFTTIGGLRTTALSINHQPIEADALGSGAWRTLLQAAGIGSVTLTGTGIFTGSSAETALRTAALAHQIKNYQLTFGSGEVLSAAFSISAYQRTGSYDTAETFSVTLASSGPVTMG